MIKGLQHPTTDDEGEVAAHLVCEVEVGVHLDHLPAAVAVLIDSYEEAGVVLFAPLDVKVCRLGMAWNHIPGERPPSANQRHGRQRHIAVSPTGGAKPRSRFDWVTATWAVSLFHKKGNFIYLHNNLSVIYRYRQR